MSCCPAEIHIGDTPTWHIEITDYCLAFDPSTASVLELIFKMPNGVILRKSASVVTEGSPADKWFLDYEVQPGDGIGSPGEFFDNEGPVAVQGYLQWADGKQFHTNIQTVDTDGNQLQVFPNLD